MKEKKDQVPLRPDRKKKKANPAAENKRRSNRAVPEGVKTTMRLGRSLRSGGAYVVKVSKTAYKGFNTFTQGGGPASSGKKRPQKVLPRNLAYLIFLLTIFVIISVALMVLNNASVSVDKQTVSIVGLPEDLEGYEILLVSDLHARSFGNNQASLVRNINSQSYDLLLFTGDMVGKSGNAQPFYDLLERLTANRPTYFIPGDSDPDPVLETPREITGTLSQMVLADWVLGAQERGATYLSSTTGVDVGATTLWLSPANQMTIDTQATLRALKDQVAQETEGTLDGMQTDRDNLPLTDWRYRQMQKQDAAMRQMKPEDTHIALSHYPITQDYLNIAQQLSMTATESYSYLPTVDMVLAGHYCGGAWNFPLVGTLYVPDTMLPRHGWFPPRDTVKGLRTLGNVQMYTSPGLSVTDKLLGGLINFRLFNPPTITIITLTSAITDDLLGAN